MAPSQPKAPKDVATSTEKYRNESKVSKAKSKTSTPVVRTSHPHRILTLIPPQNKVALAKALLGPLDLDVDDLRELRYHIVILTAGKLMDNIRERPTAHKTPKTQEEAELHSPLGPLNVSEIEYQAAFDDGYEASKALEANDAAGAQTSREAHKAPTAQKDALRTQRQSCFFDLCSEPAYREVKTKYGYEYFCPRHESEADWMIDSYFGNEDEVVEHEEVAEADLTVEGQTSTGARPTPSRQEHKSRGQEQTCCVVGCNTPGEFYVEVEKGRMYFCREHEHLSDYNDGDSCAEDEAAEDEQVVEDKAVPKAQATNDISTPVEAHLVFEPHAESSNANAPALPTILNDVQCHFQGCNKGGTTISTTSNSTRESGVVEGQVETGWNQADLDAYTVSAQKRAQEISARARSAARELYGLPPSVDTSPPVPSAGPIAEDRRMAVAQDAFFQNKWPGYIASMPPAIQEAPARHTAEAEAWIERRARPIKAMRAALAQKLFVDIDSEGADDEIPSVAYNSPPQRSISQGPGVDWKRRHEELDAAGRAAIAKRGEEILERRLESRPAEEPSTALEQNSDVSAETRFDAPRRTITTPHRTVSNNGFLPAVLQEQTSQRVDAAELERSLEKTEAWKQEQEQKWAEETRAPFSCPPLFDPGFSSSQREIKRVEAENAKLMAEMEASWAQPAAARVLEEEERPESKEAQREADAAWAVEEELRPELETMERELKKISDWSSSDETVDGGSE